MKPTGATPHPSFPRVGITGGIGSGKSTVCRIFQETFGIPVFNADSWAKNLIESDPELKRGIISIFGEEAYDDSGRYNRPFVATAAFSSPEKLSALNALVHPAVEKAAIAWHLDQVQSGAAYTIKEAALMVESGSYRQLDYLIVVSAPEDLRLQRVMDRDGLSETQVRARMKGQWPESEKLALADFVIYNDGSQLLLPQIWQAHRQILVISQN
ncbi:MAG: dephospho-CoA kinase [Saprospiraceae bacterium]|nr:dephospho-CoA kinase [Saprospiraceae bacterium]